MFRDFSLMVNCSDWEDLNTKYRIATLRYGRFIDSLIGLDEPKGTQKRRPISKTR
jgi:hypothetical protein